MKAPRIGTRVRILSTGEEGTLVFRFRMMAGKQRVLVDYDKPDQTGHIGARTWASDIEAIPKQRRKK